MKAVSSYNRFVLLPKAANRNCPTLFVVNNCPPKWIAINS